MLTLTARTRVVELEQGPPALMTALQSTGLFRAGDDPDVTLAELCGAFGFNAGILLMVLESANVPVEEEPPVDIVPYQAMPLLELVDHIEHTHHVRMRQMLPRLVTMAETAAAAHPVDERLAELREEINRMAAELEAHLRHEEEALFPMVRDLETSGTITPTRCGSALGGPIACMENEHDMAVRGLHALRRLTGNYSAALPADPAWAGMLEEFADFDRDLRIHMYKENEVLFPRALDRQRAARVTAD
jgi:regulator of cell morphogenesis and NO signaling